MKTRLLKLGLYAVGLVGLPVICPRPVAAQRSEFQPEKFAKLKAEFKTARDFASSKTLMEAIQAEEEAAKELAKADKTSEAALLGAFQEKQKRRMALQNQAAESFATAADDARFRFQSNYLEIKMGDQVDATGVHIRGSEGYFIRLAVGYAYFRAATLENDPVKKLGYFRRGSDLLLYTQEDKGKKLPAADKSDKSKDKSKKLPEDINKYNEVYKNNLVQMMARVSLLRAYQLTDQSKTSAEKEAEAIGWLNQAFVLSDALDYTVEDQPNKPGEPKPEIPVQKLPAAPAEWIFGTKPEFARFQKELVSEFKNVSRPQIVRVPKQSRLTNRSVTKTFACRLVGSLLPVRVTVQDDDTKYTQVLLPEKAAENTQKTDAAIPPNTEFFCFTVPPGPAHTITLSAEMVYTDAATHILHNGRDIVIATPQVEVRADTPSFTLQLSGPRSGSLVHRGQAVTIPVAVEPAKALPQIIGGKVAWEITDTKTGAVVFSAAPQAITEQILSTDPATSKKELLLTAPPEKMPVGDYLVRAKIWQNNAMENDPPSASTEIPVPLRVRGKAYKSLIFVLALNEYNRSDLRQLHDPLLDGTSIRDACIQEAGYDKDQIFFIFGTETGVRFSPNFKTLPVNSSMPAAPNGEYLAGEFLLSQNFLNQAFKEFVTQVGENEATHVLLIYSGHGQEVNTVDEFALPKDGEYVREDDWADDLVTNCPALQEVAGLYNSCRDVSGGVAPHGGRQSIDNYYGLKSTREHQVSLGGSKGSYFFEAILIHFKKYMGQKYDPKNFTFFMLETEANLTLKTLSENKQGLPEPSEEKKRNQVIHYIYRESGGSH